MDTSISIIITIFNRKEELTELLNSLSNQVDKKFETIIIDDGSTDNLYPIIKLFDNKLNIKYFKKNNSGPGLSRNFGAKKANGEWLIFLDSDVIVENDFIINIKNNISKNPTSAFGGADKSHKDFNFLQKSISYSMTSILTTGGIRGNKNAVSKFQPRSFNMGIKKDIFQRIGGFSNMRIGEDIDLSMKIWKNKFSTRFYDNISVYHKRRSSLNKFAKQVYQFGCARPILNQYHPQYTKSIFWLPSMFLLGLILASIIGFLYNFWIFFYCYCLYFTMIFLHSSYINKNIFIGFISIATTFIQLCFYGIGFLESWIKLNILKISPKNAFPKHFY